MIKILATGINPTLLGVPDRWVDADPSPNRYPQKFNPDAEYIWLRVLSSAPYLEQIKGMSSTDKWGTAIQHFLVACGNEDDLNPFNASQQHDLADNSLIINLLGRARRHIVKWFNRNELLSIFTIRDRWITVDITERGFVLRSWCKAFYTGTPLELEQLLRGPHIGLKPALGFKQRTFGRMIDPTVWVYCTVKNSSWVHLHYSMVINHRFFHPDVERGRRVLSADLKKWIERTLWLPAVRSYKLHTTRSTLF